MPKQISLRPFGLSLVAIFVVAALAGCGSDAKTTTGGGAPDGATGGAAGGAAVEAGKQRDPADVAAEKKNFSKEPPPVQIQSGNSSGYRVSTPTAKVVSSRKEMRALRNKIYSNGATPDPWAPSEFSTRQLVAVIMPKGPKGSLIAITDIFQNGKVIKVKTVELLPGDGCKVSSKPANPWQVVETRKMPGTPVVVLTKQNASPC